MAIESLANAAAQFAPNNRGGLPSQAGSRTSVSLDLAVDLTVAQVDTNGALSVVSERITLQFNAVLEQRGLNPITSFNPADFTPEAVSDRILNFARGFIDLAQNPQELEQVFADVERGIRQGLAEAREVLQALDVLNGTVKEGVDSTEQLLFAGLSQLKTDYGLLA